MPPHAWMTRWGSQHLFHGFLYMGPADSDGDFNRIRLLTVGEAAERLGWTKTKVQHAYKRGHLPVIRVGRRVYFAERDLLNLSRPVVESLPKLSSRRQPPKELRFTPRSLENRSEDGVGHHPPGPR